MFDFLNSEDKLLLTQFPRFRGPRNSSRLPSSDSHLAEFFHFGA